MRYIACALAGIALAVAGIALLTAGVHAVTHSAACASRSDVLEAIECTRGIGGDIVLLIAGGVLIVAGLVVFGVRGDPGGGSVMTPDAMMRRRPRAGIVGAAWGMSWIALGAAIWYAANGPNGIAPEDDAVVTILAAVFGGIGALSLLGVLAGLVIGRRAATTIADITTVNVQPGGVVAGGDVADLIRQAQEIARRHRAGDGPMTSAGTDEFGEPPPPGGER